MLKVKKGKSGFSQKKKTISDFMSVNESNYAGIEKEEEPQI